MRNWFKPLSKRNATFAAAVIGFLLICGIIAFVKDLLSGLSFDELRSNIILLIFGAIIEYAMVTIARSDDKNEGEEADAAAEEPEEKALPLTEEEQELEKLAEKYTEEGDEPEGLAEKYAEEK